MPHGDISVVIITHDRYELVQEAIECALSQTLRPCEVVVVDDGSPRPIEPRYRSEHPPREVPIRFVRIEDLGPSTARNAGVACSKGELVALLDDDDQWEPGYLAACAVQLQHDASECVITWMTCFDQSRRWPGKCIPQSLDGLDLFRSNHGVVGSNIVITRRAFDAVGGFDETLLGSEDKDFLIRLLQASIGVVVHPQPLVLYRVHAASQASGHGNYHRFQVSGKARFVQKHGTAMSPDTRRALKAESGYFRFRGGEGFWEKMNGLLAVLANDPLLIPRRVYALVRKCHRQVVGV